MNTQSDIQTTELYKWVDEHQLSRPKRILWRDFADAVPLAEILKQHYPRMVDLHNYIPRNAFADKLINWDTLNRKVLAKLHLSLNKERMEHLAKGEQASIEKLLADVKKKIESKPIADETEKHPTTPRKPTSQSIIEKLEKELTMKNLDLQDLKNKNVHLENMLQIKEKRIEELMEQLKSINDMKTKSYFGSLF